MTGQITAGTQRSELNTLTFKSLSFKNKTFQKTEYFQKFLGAVMT